MKIKVSNELKDVNLSVQIPTEVIEVTPEYMETTTLFHETSNNVPFTRRIFFVSFSFLVSISVRKTKSL